MYSVYARTVYMYMYMQYVVKLNTAWAQLHNQNQIAVLIYFAWHSR